EAPVTPETTSSSAAPGIPMTLSAAIAAHGAIALEGRRLDNQAPGMDKNRAARTQATPASVNAVTPFDDEASDVGILESEMSGAAHGKQAHVQVARVLQRGAMGLDGDI